MPKLQDFFKKSDGTDIMDTPIAFTIESLRGHISPDTRYGEKTEIHLRHAGEPEVVTWDHSEEGIQRIFRRVFKDKVEWEAKDGDAIFISKCTPRTPGGNIYYKAEPADGRQAAPSTPSIRPASKSQSNGPDWGGTPRQKAFRDGLLQSVTSFIVASGKPELTDQIKQDACDLVIWSRTQGDELEKTYPMH